MKEINISLNSKSIKTAQKNLEKYSEWIKVKTTELVEKLAEIGIETAKEYSQDKGGTFGTHQMGQHVKFQMKVEANPFGATRIIVGFGSDVPSAINEGRSINALYALEFGTAALGLEPYKGTNSTAGHDNDLIWYHYDEETGTYKVLSAIAPTRPMHNAYLEILDKVQIVVKEVFYG